MCLPQCAFNLPKLLPGEALTGAQPPALNLLVLIAFLCIKTYKVLLMLEKYFRCSDEIQTFP